MIDPKGVIFIDIDTQFDFMDPKGALYVSGAEEIIGNLKKLISFARDNDIVVVATSDAHAPNDPEFKIWPPHCVKGSEGARKISATEQVDPFVLEMDYKGEIPEDRREYLVEKSQGYSFFDNPRADELLEKLGKSQAVVFGVATDYCVKAAVEGLLERGWKVFLVTDAIKAIDEKEGERLLKGFESRGVKLVRTVEVTG